MADLSALIRVRKHALEQKQKALAELYAQAEELAAQKKNLLDTLEAERKKVDGSDIKMLSYFGPYSEAVMERVENIDQTAAKLENRIEIAREDMRASFNELKKIQITQDRRDEEEKKANDKKETNDLNEIAVEIFRRGED